MGKIVLGKRYENNLPKEIVDEVKEVKKETKRKEDVSKRTLNSKHYKNEDGTYTMKLCQNPIHFYNEATKEYEDIDNSFEREEGKLRLKKNNFKIDFAEDLSENDMLSMENKGKKIGLKYKGKRETNGRKSFTRSHAKTKLYNSLSSELLYENVAPSTDLEYIVYSDRVKENIIVKERQEEYEYDFELEVNDLEVRLSRDNRSIELLNKDTNEVTYVIPSPVMFDANNQKSEDVEYEIYEISNGVLSLRVKASKVWINDAARLFPVKIDPQIVATLTEVDEVTKQYSIVNSEIIAHGGYGVIGDTGDSNSHLVIVDLTGFQNFSFVNAKLCFAMSEYGEDTFPLRIMASNSDDTVSNNHLGEYIDFDSFSDIVVVNCVQGIDYEIDIKDAMAEAMENNFQKIALVIDNNNGCNVWFSLPTLDIVYQEKSKKPVDYISQGNEVVVEHIEAMCLGIDEEGEGILTTYVLDNSIVMQTYLVNGRAFTRSSLDQNSVLSWTNWVTNNQASEIAIVDTRNDDFSPSYYWSKGNMITNEFKLTSSLGADGFDLGTCCILTTYTPWFDNSGGLIRQELRCGKKMLYRTSKQYESTFIWDEWIEEALIAKFIDTRLVNLKPGEYIAKGSGIYNEFKETIKILLNDTRAGAYGMLTTSVPWGDASGGLPTQEFKSNGVLFIRSAINIDDWSKWKLAKWDMSVYAGVLIISDMPTGPQLDVNKLYAVYGWNENTEISTSLTVPTNVIVSRAYISRSPFYVNMSSYSLLQNGQLIVTSDINDQDVTSYILPGNTYTVRYEMQYDAVDICTLTVEYYLE